MEEYCFAYGSNTNRADWDSWCERHGFRPDCIAPSGRVILPDMRLAFDWCSRSRKGGVLNLRQSVGSYVEGILLRVEGAGWEALDCKEGVPKSYERRCRIAHRPDGSAVSVVTYEVPEERCERPVPPHPDYLDVVRRGYEDHGLDFAPVKAAARESASDNLVHGLFVYGTLMRGQCNHRILGRCRCVILARCIGRLHDLGDFPGLVLPRDGEEPHGANVAGEFVMLDDPARALSCLDAFEGPTFRRVLFACDVGDGRIRSAWTYVIEPPGPGGAPAIASGSWRRRRGEEDAFLRALVRAHAERRADFFTALAAVTRSPFAPDAAPPFSLTEGSVAAALADGTLSERLMSRASGDWCVVP